MWKFEKPKIPYILEKKLMISIDCSEWKKEDGKIFKDEESIEISKILGSIEKLHIL